MYCFQTIFFLCRIGLPKYSQLFKISETKLQKTFFLLCVCNVFFFIQKAINYIVIICLINQIISVRKKANQNQHSKVKQCAWKEEKYSEEKREKKNIHNKYVCCHWCKVNSTTRMCRRWSFWSRGKWMGNCARCLVCACCRWVEYEQRECVWHLSRASSIMWERISSLSVWYGLFLGFH